MKFAVVKTGGKQYLVHENDEIVVDLVGGEKDTSVELDVLAIGNEESGEVELGTPFLTKKAKGTIV